MTVRDTFDRGYGAIFNREPHIERVHLDNGGCCYVIDDALAAPERLVAFAMENAGTFAPTDINAYPGILLRAPEPVNAALGDFFVERVRRLFDARRLLYMHSRLSLVTVPPDRLRPCQWICHRDSQGLDPGQSIQACVLYLFRDAALGGTAFYEPNLPAPAISRLFHHAGTMANDEFARSHNIRAGYMVESNDYFRLVGRIPAAWNRLIFYDGAMLHSGDIFAPGRLSGNPASGRLTLNGFFTCRRNAL
ncbi:MAG: DUF6445 family protein [Rudaea sp.]